VCGSPDHPLPAVGHGRRISDAQETEARRAVDAAETALAAALDRHTGLSATLASHEALAGGVTQEEAETAAADAQKALEAASSAAKLAPELEVTALRLAGEATDVASRTEKLQGRLETAVPELAQLTSAIAALTERVDRARGDHPTVTDRRKAISQELDRCAKLLKAREQTERATIRVDQAEPSARAAATAAGFDSLESAAAALLDDEELNRLGLMIAEHERDLASVTDRLTDPDLLEAAGRPEADVDAAAAERQVAEVALEASTRRLTLAESAARELAEIQQKLAVHEQAAAEIEAEYALVDGLARCADGSGGDNTKRMSLSSYVLAARLEQVAGAASERLSRMSSGRYALVHTDERERGGARSGLGLRIVDGWTGRQRETATLSGGETFYASLALALGMADVVSHESGGLSLETLFIDEGFGSLDEDTLDEVLDVLDDLRSGGRVVGVVSHVPDLRTRLPQRLEVIKGRGGSHVRQTAI
jgi:exonuclease SbcC